MQKNKDVNKCRTHFTSKSSIEHTNEDLFCRFIVSSNPYLSLQHLTELNILENGNLIRIVSKCYWGKLYCTGYII